MATGSTGYAEKAHEPTTSRHAPRIGLPLSTDGELMVDTTAPVDFRTLFRELRGILRSHDQDLERSLQAIVELLATHFASEVCSLYHLDDSGERLMLRATQGLRPEAVGQTALTLGEGLVGTVAHTRRSLALESAQSDPRFVFRPETGEEIYQSFLGIPLIRAQTLLGVLVIQHSKPRRYSEHERDDCETVAQFLSEMLHQVSSDPVQSRPTKPTTTLRLAAVPLSAGLALGRVAHYRKEIVIRRWRTNDPAPELMRLQVALQDLEAGLEALLQVPEAATDAELQESLEADLMLARDRGWRQKIEATIAQGLTAEAAAQSIREDLRRRMKAVTNDYIRERLLDLDDLSYRLLAKLTGQDLSGLTAGLQSDSILICRSLGAPELLQLGRSNLAGLVVVDATPTSHLAIIANALRIPALGQVPDALTELHDSDPVILDAINGQLIARPSEAIVAEFEAHVAARRDRATPRDERPPGPCQSRDGVPIQLMANAGLLLDLEDIVGSHADGIGLYRTEMAFLIRDRFPSVEDQTQLYERVYQRMGDKPIVFRTLDVGSDKKLPYFDEHVKEANPALGWRAIRIGLDHGDLLRDQLRALLAASDGRPLRIMFPMVTEFEEFEAARRLVDTALVEHLERGNTKPEPLEVGIMIEVPALLWDLERILSLADFASVGTNDLFQFLNAADRNNPRTDKRFDTLRPVNLRVLREIAETASKLQTPISVCGEMAATPLGAIALVGCGFQAFSMSAVRLDEIRPVLAALDVGTVRERVQTLVLSDQGTLRDEIETLARAFGIDPL